MKSTLRVPGHSLVRSLIRSHRSLVHLLHTACFARAFRCDHSLARLLTRSRAHGIFVNELHEFHAVSIHSLPPSPRVRHHCTPGRNGMKLTSRVLGHSFAHLLVRSYSQSFACCTLLALLARCAHSLASLLTCFELIGNRRRQSPVEYKGNLYVPTSVRTYVHASPPMAIWSQGP